MVKTRGSTSEINESSESPKRLPAESKVFLMKNDILKCPEDVPIEIVPLRNPASNEVSYYMFANNKVFEIMEFDESKRSWFINQTVSKNGKMYLVTIIDPLFLLLPYVIQECQNNAIPIDQILKEDRFEDTIKLLNVIPEKQLECISDVKKFEDLTAIKYNEGKCLNWLEKKCNKLSELLKQKNIQVGSGAVSATFVKSTKLEDIDEIEYVKYAHGIISEYLSIELSEQLQKHLKIPEETNPAKKRKSLAEFESKGAIKKSKLEVVDDHNTSFTSNNTPIKKEKIIEKKPTAKTKALAKSASGTKSISSFFKKK